MMRAARTCRTAMIPNRRSLQKCSKNSSRNIRSSLKPTSTLVRPWRLRSFDRKTIELIKIGISAGAGLETATRSHVRRAMKHGSSDKEIEQAVLLAYKTVGWPRMIAAWTWADSRSIEARDFETLERRE